ncbi:MAG: GGDEF domain-containing protein, partial [Burkholderiales bacterium]|nr:GGDEF domain-containing protein [Burkholderiales bacterium]
DQVALMFIDLDGFKAVNDTLGHEIGDEVLRLAADRVRRCARDNETVARLGGDEFAVLLDPLLDETKPTAAAERILAVFREPLTVAGRAVQVTLSIGVAVFPDNASDSDALLRCADAAMFHAKSLGRNTCQVYVSHDQPFGAQFVLDARANRH